MILLDTSGLLAALDASQSHHTAAAASLAAARPPLLLSPFVHAELDYLISTRVGAEARASVLEEVERGAYLLETMTSADVASAHTSSGATPPWRSASSTLRSWCSPSVAACAMC